MMEEIGPNICLCDHAQQTIPSHLICLLLEELVPLIIVKSVAQSSLKSVQPVFCYSLIKSSFPKESSCGSCFFIFLYFHCILYKGLREPCMDICFQIFVLYITLGCLITHSFFNQTCTSISPMYVYSSSQAIFRVKQIL